MRTGGRVVVDYTDIVSALPLTTLTPRHDVGVVIDYVDTVPA